MRSIAAIAFALVLGVITPAYAQSARPLYVFANWQTEQGLPQNTVHAVALDGQGYLWVGTSAGLARFDGVRFKVFGVADFPSLRSGYMRSVYAGSGALWIGTQSDGLIHFKDGVATAYDRGDGLPAGPVLSIRADAKGDLWINTLRGVARFVDGKPRPYAAHQGRAVREFLLEARDGGMWFRSGNDVARFGRDGSVTVVPGGALAHEARDGSVWIGFYEQYRAARYYQGSLSDVPLPVAERPQWTGAYPKQGVIAMASDIDGELLVMTPAGIARAVGGRLAEPEALARPVNPGTLLKVLSLVVDREGNRWVGTVSMGLLRFRQAPVIAFGKDEGMSDAPVRAVFQERDGRIWVGGDESLYWFDGRQFHLVPEVKDVRTLAQTRDGDVWVGGSGGLYRWRAGRITRYRIDAPAVADILEDRDGVLWIVAQTYDRPGGLFRFHDGEFEEVPGFKGAANIVQDRNGGFWIGGLSGLFYMREGKTVPYGQSQGLPRNIMDHVFLDSSGTAWIPTGGGGLCRLRNGRFTPITTRDGLPTDEFVGLLEDANGYLWAGSNQGVYRFRLEELNEAADGKKGSVSWVLYNVTDGMKSSECNGGPQGQWKTHDGRLWFSTMRGVVSVDPFAGNPVPPPVVLEEAWADKTRLASDGSTSAPAGGSTFDFTFTALSLAAPEKQRFKYRLVPYDKDWVDAGERRIAHYTNMAPGEYSFQVIAANSYGVWNEQGTGVRFLLRPHFYQTNSFRLVCVAAALALLWAGYRLRMWQLQRAFNIRLEERVAERTRIARDLHDTLLQSFHGLLLHLQAAFNLLPGRAPDAREVLGRAIDDAASAVTEARDAVEGLRSSPVLGGDLVGAIKQLAEELASGWQPSNGAQPEFSVEVEGDARDLHPVHRDEIYRVAGEALRNAFRHSRASRIEAEFRYDARQLRVRVRDDGVGIDPATLEREGRAGHWGLKGMRERARRLGGQLEVWSEHGAGAEVELTVPGAIAYADGGIRGMWSRRRREAAHS